ncbi:glycoside hydrolase family 16 protein [Spirochaeta dissipatitropha]
MKRILVLIIALLILSVSCTTSDDPMGNLELVWADEFEGTSLDTSKWSYMHGTGEQFGLTGWGNNELQYYTDRAENIFVQDGKLHIRAVEEEYEGMQYTSARIRTLGKGDWRYGRFEIRAKLPEGQGLWPAIWMLPSDDVYGGWAASGEIDIMELVGHEPGTVHGTLHFGGEWPHNTYSGGSYRLDSGKFSDDFNVFTLEWEEEEFRWYVNGELFRTQKRWHTLRHDFPAPFDQPFHLLMNVAVGGDWPGDPDSSTVFPQEMVIDYVRVYQAPGADNTPSASAVEQSEPAEPAAAVEEPAVEAGPAKAGLPIDFMQEGIDWDNVFNGFEGGAVEVVDNPYIDDQNDSPRVGKMIKGAGPFWAGAYGLLNESFRFSEENHTISMQVWSPREGVPVLMKIEQQDGGNTYEITKDTTTSGEWELMTWDMSKAGFTRNWDVITLIFDFRNNGVGDGGENFTWYFDNLQVHAD